MAELINMPRLSDTMEEGTVAKWYKKVGDTIREGDILAEIETDKATMEFESFQEGELLHIGIEEGGTAPVDSLLAIVGYKGEDIKDMIGGADTANVAKSKQATSRKKMIDKLNIEEIRPSSRRYPGIIFEQEREGGDQILNIEGLSYSMEGQKIFDQIHFNMAKGDKAIIFSKDSRAVSAFYEIINGNLKANTGKYEWGITTIQAYLPLDNDEFFDTDLSLVDWLRQWSQTDEEREEVYIRGFLGKMLFSGDEALKASNVLSGGEKVRCMLSKMMMARANVLMLDEPTNHLDLESITAINNSLKNFKGTVLCTTHDHAFAQTVGNRILELTPNGIIDRYSTFDDYMSDTKIKDLRNKMYS